MDEKGACAECGTPIEGSPTECVTCSLTLCGECTPRCSICDSPMCSEHREYVVLPHDEGRQYFCSTCYAERIEQLARKVREAWVAWAKTQHNPKPSWLVPWEELSEPDQEADRYIVRKLLAEMYTVFLV